MKRINCEGVGDNYGFYEFTGISHPRREGKIAMRELNDHKINPANDTLNITVLDEPGQGNACH